MYRFVKTDLQYKVRRSNKLPGLGAAKAGCGPWVGWAVITDDVVPGMSPSTARVGLVSWLLHHPSLLRNVLMV